MDLAVLPREDDELVATILHALDQAADTVRQRPLEVVLAQDPGTLLVLHRCAAEISAAAREVSQTMRNWATQVPWDILDGLDVDEDGGPGSPLLWRFLDEQLPAVRDDLAEMFAPARLDNLLDVDEQYALERNTFDFSRPAGPDLLRRTEDYHEWVQARQASGTWSASRTLHDAPGTHASICDESGRRTRGLNFASQDYLSFNTHPGIREAAARAMRDYGPHSAGSAMAVGNTVLSENLEQALADLVGLPHITLFPTGWAAGFGAVVGLVRQSDHVLMDKLTHACLQQGARAATRNVHRFEHLSLESARAHLAGIRARDTRNGILVLTDGLFSVDADWPDVVALQALCHEYNATLLVDVAHDLGSMGPGGTGVLGMQDMLGKVDLVTGAFSKTFASNGGFLASGTAAVRQYVKMFGGSHIFSNALSPVQAAIVTEATRIIRSAQGETLRGQLARSSDALRGELIRRGLTCLGSPSPIVPLLIGSDKLARICVREIFDRGVLATMVEFPVVPAGSARFRLQVQAHHTPADGLVAARILDESMAAARAYLDSAFGTGAS